ncbi:MAG: uracil-DNA glycosylase [Planctomycetes bacterium]|nr:uracil-DNA glycosylase [Planctomycetota bacterium]
MRACTLCAELAHSRTQVVVGGGNRRARLMIVGEAPGFDEDEQGVPFVGRAGKLLTQLLGAIGLRRDEIYVANVLKCRPPGNRPPTPPEMASCAPFVRRQIELVRPRVILALGNPAARTLLATAEGITRLRGTWREYQGIRLMPSFHPAYLLRNPADTGKSQEDFRAVGEYLKSLPPSAPPPPGSGG